MPCVNLATSKSEDAQPTDYNPVPEPGVDNPILISTDMSMIGDVLHVAIEGTNLLLEILFIHIIIFKMGIA